MPKNTRPSRTHMARREREGRLPGGVRGWLVCPSVDQGAVRGPVTASTTNAVSGPKSRESPEIKIAK